MIISDYLYGEFEIDDVLAELLLSKPMLLKKNFNRVCLWKLYKYIVCIFPVEQGRGCQ